MKTSIASLLLLLLTLVSSSPAVAGPISLNTWYEFGFDPNHAPFVTGCNPIDSGSVDCRAGIGSVNLDRPPWTFTSSTQVVFTITDGYLAGDSYDVFDLGVLIGSTPAAPQWGWSCGFDPRVCVLDPWMSHASFLLPAGAHSMTISVHEAQILGEGFFIVEAVPEPATLFLLGSGLALLARRRRAQGR